MSTPLVPVTDPRGRVVGHVVNQKQLPDGSAEVTIRCTELGRALFDGVVLNVSSGASGGPVETTFETYKVLQYGDELTYRIPPHELGPVTSMDWRHLVPDVLATAPERLQGERTGPCRRTDPHQAHLWSFLDTKGGGRRAMFCEGIEEGS